MLSGGLDCLPGEPGIGLLSYLGQHVFPRFIPTPHPLFSPFSIFCCVVMARQTDGAFSDSGFDPSEYSVSLYPVVCHIIWYVGSVRAAPCFCSVRLACQSICAKYLMSAVSLFRFLSGNWQKRFSGVQSQQHRLDECLFSTKYRYYVCDSDSSKGASVLYLDCDVHICCMSAQMSSCTCSVNSLTSDST